MDIPGHELSSFLARTAEADLASYLDSHEPEFLRVYRLNAAILPVGDRHQSFYTNTLVTLPDNTVVRGGPGFSYLPAIQWEERRPSPLAQLCEQGIQEPLFRLRIFGERRYPCIPPLTRCEWIEAKERVEPQTSVQLGPRWELGIREPVRRMYLQTACVSAVYFIPVSSYARFFLGLGELDHRLAESDAVLTHLIAQTSQPVFSVV